MATTCCETLLECSDLCVLLIPSMKLRACCFLTLCGSEMPQYAEDAKKVLLYATTNTTIRGMAKARIRVAIGRRTHIWRRFLRINAHSCRINRFMVKCIVRRPDKAGGDLTRSIDRGNPPALHNTINVAPSIQQSTRIVVKQKRKKSQL